MMPDSRRAPREAVRNLRQHYAEPDFAPRIRAAVAALASKPDLSPEDFAPFDQFHIRGRAATLELATLAEVGEGWRVLDLGSGLGGPSRTLAAAFGARVVGIDLTEAYCALAALLTRQLNLGDRNAFVCGDATALPFASGVFDLVWTQHVAMNIGNKPQLYAEVARVLRDGGVFALYDVLEGSGGPLHLPVPWASRPEMSHLIRGEALRGMLERAGFRERAWRPLTAEAIEWFRTQRARRAEGAPLHGLALLLGGRFPGMADNLLRNLEEGRVEVAQGVFERAA